MIANALRCVIGGITLCVASGVDAQTHLQVVGADPQAPLWLVLDRRVLVDTERQANEGPVSSLIEPIPLPAAVGRHTLIAEAPATRTKAQFAWTTDARLSPWLVVSYYAGRGTDEPPFFTFSLQDAPTLAK